jgi:hypothetical protein
MQRSSTSQREQRSTAVFFSSSDNTFDVLQRVVLPSFQQYWPGCSYPVYIGTNSARVDAAGVRWVTAPVGGWRAELASQLEQVNTTRIILFLDDFLIRAPVDQMRVARLVDLAERDDLAYLRLLPLESSLGAKLLQLPRSPRCGELERIPTNRPYYSALQVAIWRRTHLLESLSRSGSIWEFEHERCDGVDHYAVSADPPIRYRHLVEKGRWLADAGRLLRESGFPDDLGTRPTWPGRTLVKRWVAAARFHVIGYAGLRLRRWLGSVGRRRTVVS